MEKLKKQIPNILSVIRLLCIPVFVLLFNQGHRLTAAGVFCGASLTDVVDGYLARKNNWVTNIGKILDPLADKLMQFTVLLCLTISFRALDSAYHTIALIVLILFTLKELAMLAGAIVVLRVKRNVVASVWYGKLATVIFFVITITMILGPNSFPLGVVLCTLLVCTILFALIMYYVKIFRGQYGMKKFENMRRTKE